MAIYDMSEFQLDPDFEKVKLTADFVILRVQAGYTHPDKKYKQYVEACKANNIHFGTYAYGKYVSVNDAIAEADSAFNLTDPASKFFAVDVEAVTTKSPADLVKATQAFIDRLKAKGLKNVGLYSGENFFVQHGLSAVNADWLWLANYGVNDGQPHNKPVCDLWQYTSVGKVDGVNTNVDISCIAGSKPLTYFTGEPKVIFFLTGGFGPGNALCDVYQYIFDRKWYWEATRKDDGTLTFKVGGLGENTPAANDFENFLKTRGYWYSIVPAK